MVTLSLRVLSRPDISHLPQIYQSLGTDYDERVLPSIGNEVLKAIVAQFDAAELITQREVVSARIREDLLARAREFNIVLEDVSIVRRSHAHLHRPTSLSGKSSRKPSSKSRLPSKTLSVPSLLWKRPSRSARHRSCVPRVRLRLPR